MIIPLYNLQAHNVMTNCIVDAGTDAKIAKFHKRGLEVIGLAMLEVVETMRGASWSSDDRQGQGQGHQVLHPTDGHTPTSSHLSLSSDVTHESPPLSHHQPTPPTPQHTPQPEKSGARRLFGKVFKKKGDSNASPQPNSPYIHSSSNKSPLPSLDRDASLSTTPKAPSKRSSLLLASAQSPSQSDQQASAQQQQTVLGIQPTLHGGVSRPTRYVWVVRKWLKSPPTGIALPAVGLNPGQGVIDTLMEVTFEWTRSSSGRTQARKGKDKGARAKRRTDTGAFSNTPSMSSLRKSAGRSEARGRRSTEADGDGECNRARSPESVRTSTTGTTDDGSPRRRAERDDDDGSDSDPEDSDTPWTCQVVVRKLYGQHEHRLSYLSEDGRSSPAPSASHGDVKVKVAAVVPAPHHPKVVSLLKIPFPLPDIIISSRRSRPPHHSPLLHPQAHLRPSPGHEIEIDVEARKRVVTPSGVARPAVLSGPSSPPATPTQAAMAGAGAGAGLNKLAGKFKSTLASAAQGVHSLPSEDASAATHNGGEGVLLSAEEIKDIVCCTACWVVVREGFGGVGKVNRKGDGWRIRG